MCVHNNFYIVIFTFHTITLHRLIIGQIIFDTDFPLLFIKLGPRGQTSGQASAKPRAARPREALLRPFFATIRDCGYIVEFCYLHSPCLAHSLDRPELPLCIMDKSVIFLTQFLKGWGEASIARLRTSLGPTNALLL